MLYPISAGDFHFTAFHGRVCTYRYTKDGHAHVHASARQQAASLLGDKEDPPFSEMFQQQRLSGTLCHSVKTCERQPFFICRLQVGSDSGRKGTWTHSLPEGLCVLMRERETLEACGEGLRNH